MTGPDYSAEYLRSQLQDIGDGLAAAFVTLSMDPHPGSCEMMGIRLQGALKHVQHLAEALRRKERGE